MYLSVASKFPSRDSSVLQIKLYPFIFLAISWIIAWIKRPPALFQRTQVLLGQVGIIGSGSICTDPDTAEPIHLMIHSFITRRLFDSILVAGRLSCVNIMTRHSLSDFGRGSISILLVVLRLLIQVKMLRRRGGRKISILLRLLPKPLH